MPRERELFVVLRIRARGKKCKVIFFFLTKIQAVSISSLRLLVLHLAFQVRNRLESFLYGKLLQLVLLCIDFIASEITI